MQTVWITGKIIGPVSHSLQTVRGGCEHRGMGISSLSCAGDVIPDCGHWLGRGDAMAKGAGARAAAAGMQHSWCPEPLPKLCP